MKDKNTLSLSDMVLVAAYHAAEATTKRIPFETLVIQAWREFPKHFSLKDHPEYPDSSAVYQRLYTDLLAKRLFISLRKQVVRLTDKGLELAQQIEANMNDLEFAPPAPSEHLNREQQDFIDHALRSRAFRTWQEGKEQDLIDYDVRVFLQFSAGTPVRERKRKLQTAQEAVDKTVDLEMAEGIPLQNLLAFIINKYPKLFEEA
jgi:hypothetical protein